MCELYKLYNSVSIWQAEKSSMMYIKQKWLCLHLQAPFFLSYSLILFNLSSEDTCTSPLAEALGVPF